MRERSNRVKKYESLYIKLQLQNNHSAAHAQQNKQRIPERT